MIKQYIIKYLKENNINNTSAFTLRDNGSGVFISSWEYGIAKPTLPTKEEIEISSLKDRKKDEVSRYREEQLVAPTSYTVEAGANVTFNGFKDADRVIKEAIEFLQDESLTSTYWNDIDNNSVELTISDLQGLRAHLRPRRFGINSEYAVATRKKAAIEALETIEEVEAFDITQPIIV